MTDGLTKTPARGQPKLTTSLPPFWPSSGLRANRDLAWGLALGPAWALNGWGSGAAGLIMALLLLGGALTGALGWCWLTGEPRRPQLARAAAAGLAAFFLAPAGLKPWLAPLATGLGPVLANLLRGGPGGAVPAALWSWIFMTALSPTGAASLEPLSSAVAAPPQWPAQNILLALGGLGLWAWGYRGPVRVWGVLAAAGLAAAACFSENAVNLDYAWLSFMMVNIFFLAPQIRPWPLDPLAGWGLSVACGLALGWLGRLWGPWSGPLILLGTALAAPWLDDLTAPKPFGA